jgi:hypothetical protein
MGFFEDLKSQFSKENVGPIGDVPKNLGGGIIAAITRTEENFSKLLSVNPSVGFGRNVVGRATGLKGSAADGADNAKFTGTGGAATKAEEIRNYAMMSGLDDIIKYTRDKINSNEQLTPEDMQALTQASQYLGSLYNGADTQGSRAALDTLNFITNVQDDDVGTLDFYETFAKLGSQLPAPGTTAGESELTASLQEQQELALEAQRVQTLMAQRNYEREGVMSVIQMLPSASRLQFMADLFAVPKFAQMFFGDLDAGLNDGPYVGGVLGSTVQPGTTAQTQGITNPRSLQDKITQGQDNLKASLGGAR